MSNSNLRMPLDMTLRVLWRNSQIVLHNMQAVAALPAPKRSRKPTPLKEVTLPAAIKAGAADLLSAYWVWRHSYDAAMQELSTFKDHGGGMLLDRWSVRIRAVIMQMSWPLLGAGDDDHEASVVLFMLKSRDRHYRESLHDGIVELGRLIAAHFIVSNPGSTDTPFADEIDPVEKAIQTTLDKATKPMTISTLAVKTGRAEKTLRPRLKRLIADGKIEHLKPRGGYQSTRKR